MTQSLIDRRLFPICPWRADSTQRFRIFHWACVSHSFSVLGLRSILFVFCLFVVVVCVM